ncbi:GTP cyclohydrolase I FolE2 [bacterium]|nr:GTP cyclohydrolase I FolE2 [bacterium]
MNDVQYQEPQNRIPINQVGVKNLNYPIRVLDRRNEFQSTIAEIAMFVDLPEKFRGTHMSRFIEILNKYTSEIAYKELRPVLEKMLKVFDARCAHLSMKFPYFIEKQAPVSKTPSLMKYDVFFDAKLSDTYEFELGVKVPVLTLCPCSKEISDRGAHNQRASITITIKFAEFVWLEELIDIAEQSASSPVYSLLKRPDEKFITEKSYDNPKFVEDVVRDAVKKLNDDDRITYAKIEAESSESIHNHNAYAMIELQK